MTKKIWFLWLCFTAQQAMAKDYPITAFGATPGKINTAAINKAVQQCHADGGGRVVVPPGVFSSGTIVMKDNVELHLETGAILLADTSLNELPLQPRPAYRSQKDPGGWRALIYANEAVNIAITGRGTIDGNGAAQQPVRSGGGELDGRPSFADAHAAAPRAPRHAGRRRHRHRSRRARR